MHKDAEIEAAGLAAGLTREQVDEVLADLKRAGRERAAVTEPLPVGLTFGRAGAWCWCEQHGGHSDNGGMFFATCSRCGWSEGL